MRDPFPEVKRHLEELAQAASNPKSPEEEQAASIAAHNNLLREVTGVDPHWMDA